jgi:hypothetical protein
MFSISVITGCKTRLAQILNIKSKIVHHYILFFAVMYMHDDLQQRWWNLEAKLAERFGKKPDLDAILYLIGMQELQYFNEKITKEQKQDLMHVAVCTILTPSGYYELEVTDVDGWPHFKQLKPLPELGLREQEEFLKDHVLLYFEQQERELS